MTRGSRRKWKGRRPMFDPDAMISDGELWAVSIAANAAATFNSVLQRLANKGMYVKVEVVQVGQLAQVSCDLDLGVRTQEMALTDILPALLLDSTHE